MSKEKRQFKRTKHHDLIMVKIISDRYSDFKPGMTYPCSVADVSERGVRIICNSALPSAMQVELWAIARHRRGTLILRGKTIWSKVVDEGVDYSVGIELDPTFAGAREWPLTIRQIEAKAHT